MKYCTMCEAYRDERVSDACPKHQITIEIERITTEYLIDGYRIHIEKGKNKEVTVFDLKNNLLFGIEIKSDTKKLLRSLISLI